MSAMFGSPCAIRLAVTACAAIACAHSTLAAPQPAKVTDRWQLDFAFHDLQRISLRLPGDDHETTYWYLLYTVTNNTGQDVQYFPSFELVTDTLQTVAAGVNVHPAAYEAIGKLYETQYPFYAPPHKVTGTLLQGEDNARTSVAVFQTFDDRADHFTIFVAGLSGEVERTTNPAFNANEPESDDNPRGFVLRRTLAIRYAIPGEPTTRALAMPMRKTREWVMR